MVTMLQNIIGKILLACKFGLFVGLLIVTSKLQAAITLTKARGLPPRKFARQKILILSRNGTQHENIVPVRTNFGKLRFFSNITFRPFP